MRVFRTITILLLICVFSSSLQAKGDKKMSDSQEYKSHYQKGDKDLDAQEYKFRYYYLEALRQKKAGDLSAAGDNLYRCHLINPNSAAIYFELATLSATRQNYMSARQYAEKAVKLNPENIRYRRALAEIYSSSKSFYQAAIKEYKELIKLDPDHKANYYAQIANIHTSNGNYYEACAAWDNYAEEKELTQDIVEEKFKLYLKAYNTKKAFKQIDQLIERYPEEVSYIAYKADLYAALNDSANAEKTFQKALKKFSNDPELELLYAKYLANAGDSKRSNEYYMSTFLNPKSYYDQQAVALISLTLDSTLEVSDSTYLKFIETYPSEHIPNLAYGLKLYQKKDSIYYKYFNKSLEINPDQKNIWGLLIEYYSSKRQEDSVIAIVKKAIQYYPEEPAYYSLMGQAYVNKGEKNLAIHYLRQAKELFIQQRSTIAASLCSEKIGELYYGMHEKEKAFAAFDTAIVLDENNMLALNNYAYYLSECKMELDKAEKMSLKTITANPTSPIFLDTYAWVCFTRGEYTMAQLYIEQAYNNGGDKDPELLEHYGDILFKVGEDKKIYCKYWEEALKIHEENEKGKKEPQETDENDTLLIEVSESYKGLEKLRQKVKTETYVE